MSARCTQDYAERGNRPAPFDAWTYCEDPSWSGAGWCAVNYVSDIITRVPLMPVFTYNEDDYDEDTLYDVTDMTDGYESE